jgi:serine/threonine protein kinase
MKTIFQQLGPYEILQSIGHGMAGSVFLARDTRSDRRVALKLVPHGADRDALEILAAERWGAELQKQLSQVSTHVPTVFEHGDHESGYFVAMEYLDGENLSSVISRGRLPVEKAAEIAIQLCLFLEDAHRFEASMDGRRFRSLVHGDLTPRNVRVTSDGKVKVLDFGIAKALSLSRKVTRNDFGTLWYLSPERLESGVVDEYADFWAIGVILYEMVQASRPFQAEDTRRLERLILSRSGIPALDASCPAGLAAIIAKLLAGAPDERYSSAQAIREDLERFKSGQSTLAEQDETQTRRTPRPVDSDDEQTRRTVSAVYDPPSARRELSQKKVWLIPVMALIVIVLVLTANEFWISSQAAEDEEAVPNLELTALGGAWDRYNELSDRSYLRLAAIGLGRSLSDRSTVLAERVMANYRTSLPTVREAQWQAARDALARAVAFDPNNPRLRAALLYCEGHLRRINGEANKNRRQTAQAEQDLTQAVAAFREAAELRPGWPDPFLGLARTFIYGLQDVDRGADALRQAERFGYAPGERETVQLADGYRVRGDTLSRNATALQGMPQERDYLERAAEAYRQSLSQYLSVKDFSKVGSDIRTSQRALDRVEKRLADLSAAPAPETTQ